MYFVEYLENAAFVSFWKGIHRKYWFKKTEKKVEREKKHCLISGNVKEKWAKRT